MRSITASGLPLGLSMGGFKVSSGIVEEYRCSSGADFENPEIASPASWTIY